MIAEFTIHAAPVGKARPRVTAHGTYTPKKTKAYEGLVRREYQAQCKGVYFANRPIIVIITAHFAIPKSKSKKVKEDMARGAIFPTVKPDLDNIAKSICDALNGIAWTDDSQITLLIAEKNYRGETGTSVRIMEQEQREWDIDEV